MEEVFGFVVFHSGFPLAEGVEVVCLKLLLLRLCTTTSDWKKKKKCGFSTFFLLLLLLFGSRMVYVGSFYFFGFCH